MQLLLDERETHLFEKLQSIVQDTTKSGPTISLKKQVLPLGDAILMDKEGRELAIIERKSLADLLASIKDGRYMEQSYRLLEASGHLPHFIVYVIEGMMSQVRTPQEKKMIYSAMTTLHLFKGCSVIRTCSIQETAEWLLGTADKVGRDMEKGKVLWRPSIDAIAVGEPNNIVATVPTALSNLSYCSVVKKVKKDNIVPANIGEIMLCQIPGVSTVSALAILQKFGSIGRLIDELRVLPTCLDDITCTTNGKSRKLSKTIIQNVRTFLMYAVPETREETSV